mmetsp:Transcript_36683/g.77942  ORF Transcript_36683/g.77942 Transcript_36683/m.77942 type:complete len:415 (-) Transcript_36683:181-1425(-)
MSNGSVEGSAEPSDNGAPSSSSPSSPPKRPSGVPALPLNLATPEASPGGGGNETSSANVPSMSMTPSASASGSPSEQQQLGGTELLSTWNRSKSELQELDDSIQKLRSELAGLEARREVVAQNEKTLRSQAQAQGLFEEKANGCDSDASDGDKPSEVIIFSPSKKDNNNNGGRIVFEVMTPRPASVVQSPMQAQFSPSTRREPGQDSSKPTSHRLSMGGSPMSPGRNQQEGIGEGDVNDDDGAEDWERGLDSFGVAKCGICGMKFPLDVGAIEQHSLECAGAKRDGRKPTRSDIVTVREPALDLEMVSKRDRTRSSPSGSPPHRQPAAGAAAAAAAAVAANAGAAVAALAARAAGVGAGMGPATSSGSASPAGMGPSKSMPAVGDRAALLRSRMQRGQVQNNNSNNGNGPRLVR